MMGKWTYVSLAFKAFNQGFVFSDSFNLSSSLKFGLNYDGSSMSDYVILQSVMVESWFPQLPLHLLDMFV